MSGSVKKFKEHHQGQAVLLPQDIDSLIPENDIVRVVNSVINEVDISSLLSKYKGGGTTSYHPRMMLKVLIYSYLQGNYSCRRIAKSLRENIYYMWLSGKSTPSYKTINNFRSGRLKREIEQVFASLVDFCITENYIDLNELYVDGTKMEADANKHTAIWRKNTHRYKDGVAQKVRAILKEVDQINKDDDDKYGDNDLPERGEHLNTEELKRKMEQLSDQINTKAEKSIKRELSKKRTQLKNEIKKLAKYEQQEEILAGRNSYSKTDPDATFMRWKDERLLPTYNVQASTQHQFVIHYTIDQNANDQRAFENHLNQLPERFRPKSYVGDSGYGSQINYERLNELGIDNYLKYPFFHREISTRTKDPFGKSAFNYDLDTDSYTCPENRSLTLYQTTTKKLRNGKSTKIRIYKCENCTGCRHFTNCVKSGPSRRITIAVRWEELKTIAKQNLTSDQGIVYRKRRSIDVETLFGNIKRNKRYKRFRLRGMEKVKIEFGLLAMAQNIAKMAAKTAEKSLFDIISNILSWSKGVHCLNRKYC